MSYPHIHPRILPFKINPPRPVSTDLLKEVLYDADRTGSENKGGYGNGQINKAELDDYSKQLDRQKTKGKISYREWAAKKQAVNLLQDKFNTIGRASGRRDRLSNSDIDFAAKLDGNAASLSALDLKRLETGYAFRGGTFNQLQ